VVANQLTSDGEFLGINDFRSELVVRVFLHASSYYGEGTSEKAKMYLFSFVETAHIVWLSMKFKACFNH
jgi:hypothetical protein